MSNETEVKPQSQEEARPQWNSHLGFLLATLGSAVGLGNIWRFPYIMGKYGGAAFLLVYMVLMCTVCAIPLICELFIGKKFKLATVLAYKSIKPSFKYIGWMQVYTVILIAGFYFVVGGWIFHYIFMYLANLIPQGTDYSLYFANFAAQIKLPLFYAFLFLVISAIFPYRGVNKGIETASKVMMPLFLIMLVFLVIVAQTLPGAREGLEFVFKPDFSKFNAEMFLVAFGQALFSLSVGIGVLIAYGSYLDKDTNLVESSYTLIFGETLIAVSAGLMIFPAVFSYGLNPGEGPGLVFVTLPQVFEQIPFGNVFAIIFFVLLLFAALTSSISILESPIASFIEGYKMTRKKATLAVSAIVALLVVPCSLSFGIMKDFKIFGKTFFDLLDFSTSSVLMPVSTLCLCLIAGWILKPSEEIVNNNKILYFVFNILMKYITPVLLLFSLLCGLNIIKV